MQPRWFEQAVVYQIYPLSFNDSNGDGIGDINGIIEKLDYLKTLGIDIIWLSPVYASPMDDNGYDISDYYAINPMFGTMSDFEKLLEEAHKRSMKIIMDLVVNHTSDEHPWFQSTLKDKDSQYRDYYIFRPAHKGGVPSDIKSVFSGPAWTFEKETKEYYFHLFSKKQPDLNWENKALREEIYTMINWWLDLGIDGFRLDVIDLIGKDVDNKLIGNGPYLHERLEEMYERCFKGRKLFTVGETPSATTDQAITYTNKEKPLLDMVFNFEHVGVDEIPNQGKWALAALDWAQLKTIFNKWQTALNNQGWNSLYWSNHDQPRAVSRFGDDKKYRRESAKMLATILHFMQGTPFIFQGEEIGMTNVKFNTFNDYKDIETLNMIKEKKAEGWSDASIFASIYAKGRDNARTPMQWNDSIHAGFSNYVPWLKVNPNYKTINVDYEIDHPDSIFKYYQNLITLRKTEPLIVNGDFTMIDSDEKTLIYEHRGNGESIRVTANLTKETLKIQPINLESIILTNYNQRIEGLDNLRPYEVIVTKRKVVV